MLLTPKGGASIAPFIFILVVVISGVGYGIWSVIQSHPKNMQDVIVAANAVFVVPQNLILFAFQALIVAVVLYLVVDVLLSFLRRFKKVEVEEEEVLWWAPDYKRKK